MTSPCLVCGTTEEPDRRIDIYHSGYGSSSIYKYNCLKCGGVWYNDSYEYKTLINLIKLNSQISTLISLLTPKGSNLEEFKKVPKPQGVKK